MLQRFLRFSEFNETSASLRENPNGPGLHGAQRQTAINCNKNIDRSFHKNWLLYLPKCTEESVRVVVEVGREIYKIQPPSTTASTWSSGSRANNRVTSTVYNLREMKNGSRVLCNLPQEIDEFCDKISGFCSHLIVRRWSDVVISFNVHFKSFVLPLQRDRCTRCPCLSVTGWPWSSRWSTWTCRLIGLKY